MTTQTIPPVERDTHPGADASVQPVGHPTTLLALRLLAAGALLLSAYLHFTIALENGLGGTPFTLPQLFVGQAVVAAVTAGVLLIGDRDRYWLPALAVAVGSAVPLLASVYMPLPAIGPFPPINEPVWYAEKLLSLVAAGTVPLLWVIRRIAPPAE